MTRETKEMLCGLGTALITGMALAGAASLETEARHNAPKIDAKDIKELKELVTDDLLRNHTKYDTQLQRILNRKYGYNTLRVQDRSVKGYVRFGGEVVMLQVTPDGYFGANVNMSS